MKKVVHQIIWVMVLCSCLAGCASVQNQSLKMAADDNVQLGLYYLQQKDTIHAREKLLMAMEETPHWSVAEDAMAYFDEVTGDNKNAEKYYLDALKSSSNDGAALNNYGVFLCRQHRIKKAEQMFLKAIENPQYLNIGQAYENLALCELSVSNKEKAREYFKKALEQEPGRQVSQQELKKLNE